MDCHALDLYGFPGTALVDLQLDYPNEEPFNKLTKFTFDAMHLRTPIVHFFLTKHTSELKIHIDSGTYISMVEALSSLLNTFTPQLRRLSILGPTAQPTLWAGTGVSILGLRQLQSLICTIMPQNAEDDADMVQSILRLEHLQDIVLNFTGSAWYTIKREPTDGVQKIIAHSAKLHSAEGFRSWGIWTKQDGLVGLRRIHIDSVGYIWEDFNSLLSTLTWIG